MTHLLNRGLRRLNEIDDPMAVHFRKISQPLFINLKSETKVEKEEVSQKQDPKQMVADQIMMMMNVLKSSTFTSQTIIFSLGHILYAK